MSIKAKQIVSWILVAFFSAVALLVQIIEMEDDSMNLYKGLSGLVCFVVAFCIVSKDTRSKSLLIGFIASILMFFSYFYNGNIRPNNFAWIWSYLGVAMLLYEFGANRKTALIEYYAFCIYFLYLAIFGGIESSDALGQNSANYVSVLLIFCLCVYYVALKRYPVQEFSYIPLLTLLFLSAWAANRSGIVCIGVIIPIVIVLNRKLSLKTHHRFRFILLLIITTIAILFLSNYIADYVSSLTRKTESVGMSSQRSFIWREYINGMFENIGNLILGVPTKNGQYFLLSYYNGNPHNTFLMLHSKFGIVGFITIIVYIVECVKAAIKQKDYLMIIIALLVVVRGIFDWVAFPGLYDVFYYYMIFYVISYKSNKNKGYVTV